ncbi:hypothetical protein MAHJHV51_57070 [Mycobacterium avium subsp. hominissuis]
MIGSHLDELHRPADPLQADRFGVAPLHTFCLAGAFMVPDPLTGRAAPCRWPPDR